MQCYGNSGVCTQDTIVINNVYFVTFISDMIKRKEREDERKADALHIPHSFSSDPS